MKKAVLFLSVIMWSFFCTAQTTQTIKVPLKLGNVALGSRSDSTLVIGPDGSVRHVKTSSITDNAVKLTGPQIIEGTKSFQNDIVLGTYNDPTSSFGTLNDYAGLKFFAPINGANYRTDYAQSYLSFGRNGIVQNISSDWTGVTTNSQLLMPKNKSGVIALTSDIPPYPNLTPYQNRSEKAAANGYASLDADGKVPASQIPSINLTSSDVPEGSNLYFTSARHDYNTLANLPTLTANSGITKTGNNFKLGGPLIGGTVIGTLNTPFKSNIFMTDDGVEINSWGASDNASSRINASYTGVFLHAKTLGNVRGFSFPANHTSADMTVIDGVLSRGLVNSGDYESNFTARSLITKQYLDSKLPLTGTFSGTLSSASVTVPISTQANTSYKVNVTALDSATANSFFVTNKTTTSFKVEYPVGTTGNVAFDWSVFKQ